MSDNNHDHLYNLLPAVYRLRDYDQGEPLRALLAVIEAEWQAIQSDIGGLYEDWFIETCADWVIPYIGDLVGNKPLYEINQLRRTDVAKTIYYRRRKGTLEMLTELAHDVTGWGAHAVEFFQLLGWTQNLNHQRFTMSPNPQNIDSNAVDRVGTVNLRSGDALDRLDRAFDVISHSVDVRTISRTQGWYNLRKIGFFLWRLQPYLMEAVTPRRSAVAKYGYYFSPLGNPEPLFNEPQSEMGGAGLGDETNIPGPIRPRAFYEDLKLYQETYGAFQPSQQPPNSAYYGPDRGLNIIKDGNAVSPVALICKDLSNWDRPPAGKVAVDVNLGRFTFAAGEEPKKLTSTFATYTYGFSADIGGGPYERRQSLADPSRAELQLVVSKTGPIKTIQKALQEWKNQGQPPGIIQIVDNGVYGGNVDVDLPAGGWLVIEAANGKRPDVRMVGLSTLSALAGDATLIINGLLIEGSVQLKGSLNLTLQHCTLVPGLRLKEDGTAANPDRDSLVTTVPADDLSVTITQCILGPIRMPATSQQLTIRDSIVQSLPVKGVVQPAIAADDKGKQPGPPATLERVTVWGSVYLKELDLASEVIFNDTLTVQRQQEGCVRFSYVPSGSVTPRRYRCQPDLALLKEAQELGLTSVEDLTQAQKDLVQARIRPAFTSERYGDPGYAQLGLNCAGEIRTGAEDGSEMGAFSLLKQPQREANLRLRLEEYLPFGLEAGFIFVT